MSTWDLTPDADQERGHALWKEFIDEGQQEGEYRLCRKDGTLIDTEYRAVANILPGLHLSVMRDVTERKRHQRELIEAKERAEEMSHLKSAFLANMSHELRTPLTSILGFADILAEEASEQNRDFARLIARSGQRLMDTLNSVLDLAQLESRSMKLAPCRLDLVERAREALDMFEMQARRRNIDLRLEAPDQPVWTAADAGAVDRVFNNLISNALKFTVEGHVTVAMREGASTVEAEVADTGIGIDPAFLPHIFDEFRQESTGAGREYEGVGLGLTITKRLIDQMEGTIEVESTKGEGTVFTLRLPKAAPSAGRGDS